MKKMKFFLPFAFLLSSASTQANLLVSTSKLLLPLLLFTGKAQVIEEKPRYTERTIFEYSCSSPQMVLDSQERPVITCYNQDIDRWQLIRCSDKVCERGNIATFLSEGGLGQLDIALDSDDIPSLAYRSEEKGGLDFVRCGDVTCASIESKSPLKTVGKALDPSIIIGSDNNPRISYYDSPSRSLKFATCNKPDCTGFVSITTVDDFNAGGNASLIFNKKGNPIMTYHTELEGGLNFLRCSTSTCAFNTVTRLLKKEDEVVLAPWVRMTRNGNPVVFYHENRTNLFKILFCKNDLCSDFDEFTVELPGFSKEKNPSYAIQLDTNDRPVFTYISAISEADCLMILSCDDFSCRTKHTKMITITPRTSDSELTMQINSENNALIVYQGYNGLRLIEIPLSDNK